LTVSRKEAVKTFPPQVLPPLWNSSLHGGLFVHLFVRHDTNTWWTQRLVSLFEVLSRRNGRRPSPDFTLRRWQAGTGPKHSRHHMAVFVPPGTFIASHPNEIDTTDVLSKQEPMLAADHKTNVTPKQSRRTSSRHDSSSEAS
jgi:hypothetical protein